MPPAQTQVASTWGGTSWGGNQEGSSWGASSWGGNQAKGGGKGKEPLTTQECSTHQKKRGTRYLVDDGNGGYCCNPDTPCQTGGGSAPGTAQKKIRMCQYALKVTGCSRGNLCTYAHSQEEIGTYADPDAKSKIEWEFPKDWNCPGCGDLQFARNHECRKCGTPKPPAASYLANMPANSQAAVDGDELKMPCAKHGVMRGVMTLMNDGMGGICCSPGDECDVNAAASAGGGGAWGGGWGGAGKGGGGGGGRTLAENLKMYENRNNGEQQIYQFGDRKKMKMCAYFEQGTCTKGLDCGYAHSQEEIGTVVGASQDGGGGAQPLPITDWGGAQNTGDGGGGGGGKGMMPGDWACPGCGDHQFARNTECRKCGTPNPSGGGGKGDRAAPY